MGILSAILTVGGQILGGPTGAQIGSAIGGGIEQSNASNKASKALQQGIAQAKDANNQAFEKVQGYQSPYLAEGQPALNALNSRLGLSVPPPAQNALTAGTAPASYSGYLAQNPDLAAEAARVTASGEFPSTEAYLQYHDQTYANEGRPSVADPVAAPANNLTTTTAPATPGVDPGTYGNTANPTYTPPAQIAAYTPPADIGGYTAPDNFKYDLADYTKSPGYQWQQDQAAKTTLAHASATGALQSGAALKELQDRAQQIAYGDFAQERAFAAGRSDTDRTFGLNAYTTNRDTQVGNRNFGLTAYDTNRATADDNRNFGRATYENDRNYLTDRFDTGTNNLFQVAGIGQGAAGVLSNAATTNGAANANAALGVGNAVAGNALQQGNIGAGAGADIAGAIAAAIKPKNNLTTDLQTAARTNPYAF